MQTRGAGRCWAWWRCSWWFTRRWFHYITNRPTNVDFLIATDSEMKKVNWSTRAELIGSTKVVILFVLLIAVALFVFDTIFSTIFYLMHVLKSCAHSFHP